jgi:hypothetical protein
MKRSSENSVLLVTVEGELPAQGTGFVVGTGAGPADRWVLTCNHVVGPSPTQQVKVNARAVDRIERAGDYGLDLALLHVPDLHYQPIPIGRHSGLEGSARYTGYSKLFGSDFIRQQIDIELRDELLLQNSAAQNGNLARRFDTLSRVVEPGHSGSPILKPSGDAKETADRSDRATAVVVYRLGSRANGEAQNSEGLAIALWPAARRWPLLGQLVGIEAEGEDTLRGAEERLRPKSRSRPAPPVPAKPADPEDLNKGRFGGKAQIGPYRLTGKLYPKATSKHFFIFDLMLQTSGNKLLSGPTFYLHETFGPGSYTISKPDESGDYVLREISSYGRFTAGCRFEARNGKDIMLEWDIGELEGLPARFLEA